MTSAPHEPSGCHPKSPNNPTGGEVKLTRAREFLNRFVNRGWLSAQRDCEDEQAAVDLGLRKRWLRKELSEAHFTPAGRLALQDLPHAL